MRCAVALTILGLLGLTGCGPTVGDPCTTGADCGGKSCVTGKDWAPGGYCTLPCTLGVEESCPAGTLCVEDALGKNAAACLRTCRAAGECRNGYACAVTKDSALPVCVGPDGV